VADQIHQELAELVRAEVKDPRVGMVTLTGVEITADYAWATVYFTCLPSDEATVEQTRKGLGAAAGFLQSQLGKRVRIHTTPRLKFIHDPSLEQGLAMDVLLRQAERLRSAEE
jgi:ribosome-binding factor A